MLYLLGPEQCSSGEISRTSANSVEGMQSTDPMILVRGNRLVVQFSAQDSDDTSSCHVMERKGSR